ncbi:Hsp20/alpha crystallin family protein [Fusibacter ferrireducens]|uniref:Hsp20/alpha crystallin family protein n=1 Tax=Fusibacter ferrireducens TaxID=2785058 RepID=A0ABR9ZWJ2_9FIRM|nr:Hsp20/alpha crystallin family protein [Fusibacter ferrireducens]MBF4694824.1 Hsp20/alpha crystallin family protein [Fusibacter ferrireducens]
MFKINPEKRHKNALDQLFYDVMEEKVSCAVKKGENVINTFDVDVSESERGYIIEAELPGFSIDQITIIYEDNYLSIIAQKQEASKSDFIRRERRSGLFRRNFFVEDVERENIKATLKHGVLTIELPKNMHTVF